MDTMENVTCRPRYPDPHTETPLHNDCDTFSFTICFVRRFILLSPHLNIWIVGCECQDYSFNMVFNARNRSAQWMDMVHVDKCHCVQLYLSVICHAQNRLQSKIEYTWFFPGGEVVENHSNNNENRKNTGWTFPL